ncbi:MAG: sugar ABC transporter substrate-binding protein [Verrucomicrobia bacterium]|nr:sugar ABC transporter substrate-binding protein [Verrucomicrobiota bacterium]
MSTLKTALAACTLLLVPVFLPGCGKAEVRSAGEILIGFSSRDLSAEYTAKLSEGIVEYAKTQPGVKLVMVDAQSDAQKQVSQTENFVSQKVDVIILNPCEVEASSPAIERAKAAKIPVVNVNSETKAKPDAFVGSNDEEAGRLAMEAIAKKLNGEGSVLMIHGIMGQSAQIQRETGARQVLAKFPGLKLLDHQSASWDRAKAMTLTENWIQAHKGKFQAIFAHNDEMAMGALLALERAGLKKEVYVIGVDAIAQALAAVKEGRLDATVFQDAAGQAHGAVDTALQIARKAPYQESVMIPFKLVTPENVDEFLPKK